MVSRRSFDAEQVWIHTAAVHPGKLHQYDLTDFRFTDSISEDYDECVLSDCGWDVVF